MPQTGQSILQHRELGHRSAARGMEHHMMNRPYNGTCVCVLLYLCVTLVRPAAPTLPVPPGVRVLTEQGNSAALTAGERRAMAAERLHPAEYTNGNTSWAPYMGHRPVTILTYRMATFSHSINKFPPHNKTTKAAGSSFD